MEGGEVRLDDALAEVVDRGHTSPSEDALPVCKKSLNQSLLVEKVEQRHDETKSGDRAGAPHMATESQRI